MAVLHAAFLFSCALEVVLLRRPFPGALGWTALCAFLLAQVLRYWAIASLGDRWNVRVIVVPGDVPVVRGPYRFLRHPNYLAVAVEMVALPLVHGAFLTAIVFSTLNAALLRLRIRTEELALGLRRA
jgi:methyltransferase